jgi:hypothetical protein
MTGIRVVGAAVAAVAVCGLLAIPAANVYYHSTRGKGCARCHEIGPEYQALQHSTHRKLNCTDCHVSSTRTNVRRVVDHLSGHVPEQIHMQLADVLAMSDRCQQCHQQEAAKWHASGHSTTYARIFTDPDHNRQRRLMDDCLRCHGMHVEGSIGDVVTPVGLKGPWKLRDAAMVNRPAIPCLACHSVHRAGETLSRPSPRVSGKEAIEPPSVGLFDRRTRLNIRADLLPVPAVYEGERAVRMSPDTRQSLCYQCHAALPTAQAGSGDDRTPVGVHEGLSCMACHDRHSQNTRQSCAECHPRLSNCGLDVEKMDTTFANSKSKHNIHSMKCVDCHTKGIPKGRKGGFSSASLR